MNEQSVITKLENYIQTADGDLFTSEQMRILYATDASAYREKPLAVFLPKSTQAIKKIITFARENKIPLIPRTAGTSLAGQVVGNGIVVDVSKYLNKIIELNKTERWVRVEPGVVLDELNMFLAPHGLFFGPETSTANRCMIGGMLGNNACGAHSLIYGSTRDHTISAKVILSNGDDAEFMALSPDEFEQKCNGNTFEANLYKNMKEILLDPENQAEIRKEYPDRKIKRRNTGYAIDLLLETSRFTTGTEPFNFCKLLAGSEGTLAFTTEIKLNLVDAPPKEVAVVCVHLQSLEDALKANLIALQFNPGAVELMDKTILDCTKGSIEQQKNRFFLKDDPAAILIVEFARHTREEINQLAANMENAMRGAGYGYHFPIIFGAETKKVWNLRKAGLGVLSNVPGDAKPVSVIEDTAINPEMMPDYIADFKVMMNGLGLACVYHAHIGTGELHLRPLLNLRDKKDIDLFFTVALESAKLVKKYKGSLSGEHGDGRLRGQFIPFMVGDHNYEILKQIKKTWDPDCIFNPGKIVDNPPMNTSLRLDPDIKVKEIETIFDFGHDQGILRSAEKCNGSADCRKSHLIGGTMCPSFMATRNEQNTTRARANILREFLTRSNKQNPFDHKEIYDIMDLCLSCKACKSECPSSVDVAKLKAEFLQHYYDANGVPMRTWLIANIAVLNKLAVLMPGISNFFLSQKWFGKLLGFSENRKMPALYGTTLRNWFAKNKKNADSKKAKVYLFADEFTNFNDTGIGIKTILLLQKLGYEVVIPAHEISGRTWFSKGLIRKGRKFAQKNIEILSNLISEETPLVGIEPSAILSFRDEYPEIAGPALKEKAMALAKNTLMIDEFLAREIQNQRIDKNMFTTEPKNILLHGHCQQKAIAGTNPTKIILSFPENYTVSEIPSGCCGMAGSFGYEKEHYDLSMKIGGLVLFPAVEKAPATTLIAAPGTSCRHQIFDGTKRTALHPVEILYEALRES